MDIVSKESLNRVSLSRLFNEPMSLHQQLTLMMDTAFDMEQDCNGECEVVRHIEGHTVCYVEQFGEGFWSIDHDAVPQAQVIGKLISLRREDSDNG